MAQTFTVKLSRFQSQPWGFRMQGGKDFSTPLSIQKVQADSLAAQVGLQPGDCILKINESSTDGLRHKEAQDVIVRAGNSFELTVQRGGMSLWKPAVTPLKQLKTLPKQNFVGDPTPVIKTSLAANKQDVRPAGSTHNLKAKPFGGSEVNGSNMVTALVHNQYNSPAGLYSMQNIAETLSSQAEVLTGGVKGYNFMKSDPPINKESAVYRMVKEEDHFPPVYTAGEAEEPKGMTNPNIQSRSFRDLQRALDDEEDQQPQSRGPPPGIRQVEAPQTLPSAGIPEGAPKPGDNICTECGRLIVGVFVRIKDRCMHAECFKCNTCGASLKNVGYYNINEKLYCDIHAKQVARQNPPAGNLTPVAVPAGVPFPTGMPFVPSIPKPSMPSPKMGSGGAGTPGTYGPIPFHGAPKPLPTSAPSANKPFGGPSGSTFVNRKAGAKFTWPPPKQPDDESEVQTGPGPAPSAPAPTYRPAPATQHVQYTPNVFKQSPTGRATPPPASALSPIPKAVSPTPFSSALPSFKSVTAPVTPPVAAPSTPAWAPPPPGPPASMPAAPRAPSGPSAAPAGPGGLPGPTGSSTGMTRPAPKRGRGVMKPQVAPGTRIPICAVCGTPIRGPFVTALGKTWCTDHFICVNSSCRRNLQDIGFVEEQGQLYCETCYETFLAPICSKCNGRIKGDCLNAIGKHWHPECFACSYCHTPFGNTHFFLEDGLPYCEKDWNEMFTTKCVACGFPIEAGDRWVEALNSNYHSQCFKCTICHKSLEGTSFFAKGGRPFCKSHAR